MIEGVKLNLGGRDLIVPALSFKQLRQLLPKVQHLGDGAVTAENMGEIALVVHAALSRNYQDLTIDDVEDMLDMHNAMPAVLAVMGQSGLERVEGEAVPGNR